MIEKDYYVTEALRAIASRVGERVIFKGGTSRSKRRNVIIEGFSEDIRSVSRSAPLSAAARKECHRP
jgi:predicted nucleotidyltransferase component of viral defense system